MARARPCEETPATTPGPTEALAIRRMAAAFVTANLTACAADVLKWRKRAVLPEDAKLREAALVLEPTYPDDALQQAEELVITLSLELAASSRGVSS